MTNSRWAHARMLRSTGMTWKQVGAIMGVTQVRVQEYVKQDRLLRETRAGFLDSPEEFWWYERFGNRATPRRPGFGYAEPTRWP